MIRLNTEPNMADPDLFYQALIEMHDGLSEAASARVNAKLILLLANHVGDIDVLREAMAAAAQDESPVHEEAEGSPDEPTA